MYEEGCLLSNNVVVVRALSQWGGSMDTKQQSVNYVVDYVNHAFGFIILWRGVGAKKTHGKAMAGKECSGGIVYEFSVVINLE